MSRLFLFSILFICIIMGINGQDKRLPYYEISSTSETYSAGSVVSRMIDGLGFRYYWATEGLTQKDLDFKPTPESRTTGETIHHILELTEMIANAVLKTPNGEKLPKLTFEEKRKRTLEKLKKASDVLRISDDVSQYKMIFQDKEVPFWNLINGPIEDATWHVGQIVSFRRSSGNPFPKGVNVLYGTKK